MSNAKQCNRCGKYYELIPKNLPGTKTGPKYSVTYYKQLNALGGSVASVESFDLCPDCAQQLAYWAENPNSIFLCTNKFDRINAISPEETKKILKIAKEERKMDLENHDRAAMHYWMCWFKMDEESAEDLENKGWYLIIIPDCDHAVVAQYMGGIKSFKAVVRPFENRIIQRDLIKYWTDLPEPELFDAVEDKEEKHSPATITREAAIDRLRELGWLQEHDKELTETNIRIGYDAAIMERASIAEVIEQVRREHKEEEK